MPKIFLSSTKEVAVHHRGCPVVSRVTFFEIFSSTICSPVCAILNDGMRNSNRAPRGFRIRLNIVKAISKDHVVVFIIVYGF